MRSYEWKNGKRVAKVPTNKRNSYAGAVCDADYHKLNERNNMKAEKGASTAITMSDLSTLIARCVDRDMVSDVGSCTWLGEYDVSIVVLDKSARTERLLTTAHALGSIIGVTNDLKRKVIGITEVILFGQKLLIFCKKPLKIVTYSNTYTPVMRPYSKIRSLSIDGINFNSMVNARQLFAGSEIGTLQIPANLSMNYTTNVDRMFSCRIQTFTGGKISFAKLRKANSMFRFWRGESLDLKHFSMPNVMHTDSMFWTCSAKEIRISGLNNIKSCDHMFWKSEIESLVIEDFKAPYIKAPSDATDKDWGMHYMFGALTAKLLDLSGLVVRPSGPMVNRSSNKKERATNVLFGAFGNARIDTLVLPKDKVSRDMILDELKAHPPKFLGKVV